MARDLPWYIKPILWLWRLACVTAKFLGRLWSILLGLLIFVIGINFSVTIIGSVIGLPMMVFGGMLIVCSFR